MTLKQLVSEIARREGQKSQVKVGDIREIIRIIVDMEVEGEYPSELIKKLAKRKEASRSRS